MGDFKEVKIEIDEDPWKNERETELLKLVKSINEKELDQLKNINQACEHIRERCQSWSIEVSEMTIFRFGEMLWKKAQKRHENIRAEAGDNSNNHKPRNSYQYRYAKSEHESVSGTYGEQQQKKGFSGSWTDYRKDRIYNGKYADTSERGSPKNQVNKVSKPRKVEERTQKIKTENEIEEPLAQEIISLINKAKSKTRGYVYFKEWNVKGVRWYKIGVTNNPRRRDAEQNVLPVAPKTLAILKTNSMDVAKDVEKSLHKLLEKNRIRDAHNREIFELEESAVESICAAFKAFSKQVM